MNTDILLNWYTEKLVLLDTIVTWYFGTGTLVHKYTGTLVHYYTDTLVH